VGLADRLHFLSWVFRSFIVAHGAALYWTRRGRPGPLQCAVWHDNKLGQDTLGLFYFGMVQISLWASYASTTHVNTSKPCALYYRQDGIDLTSRSYHCLQGDWTRDTTPYRLFVKHSREICYQKHSTRTRWRTNKIFLSETCSSCCSWRNTLIRSIQRRTVPSVYLYLAVISANKVTTAVKKNILSLLAARGRLWLEAERRHA
jgi:hypothetical protein